MPQFQLAKTLSIDVVYTSNISHTLGLACESEGSQWFHR